MDVDQSSLQADQQDLVSALLLGLLLVITATGAGVLSQSLIVGAGRTHPLTAVRHITVLSALAGAALFIALGLACLVLERLTYRARVIYPFWRRCISKDILDDLHPHIRGPAGVVWPVIREDPCVAADTGQETPRERLRVMRLEPGKKPADYRRQWTKADEALDALNNIAAESESPHALRFYEFKLRRRAVWGASRTAVIVGFLIGVGYSCIHTRPIAHVDHIRDFWPLTLSGLILLAVAIFWIFVVTVLARRHESRELRKTSAWLNASFLQSPRLELLRDMARNAAAPTASEVLVAVEEAD